MIRAIISDCFGVLYGSSLQTLSSLCPPEGQAELLNLAKLADYGYMNPQEFTAGVAEVVKLPIEDVQDIIDRKRAPNQPLMDYITELRGRGYKTALLSNIGSGVIEELFGRERLDRLFDTVVLSYEVQLRKPDDRIYTLCADRLGVAPEECIMVDDMPENCAGADAVGMKSVCHVDNETTRRGIEILLGR